MRSELPNDTRIYLRDESVVFKKTSDKWGGLSNMAPGYPLYVNGILIRTSEALYQACRYPDDPEVQKKIINQTSPMTAKMVGKPHRKSTRPDWQNKRIAIMKWCLRVKLTLNYEKFSELLKETQGFPIVEHSDKDDFWGAKPVDQNTLVGVNALGRLLMELREIALTLPSEKISIVHPPKIENFMLFGEQIREIHAGEAKPFNSLQNSLFDI